MTSIEADGDLVLAALALTLSPVIPPEPQPLEMCFTDDCNRPIHSIVRAHADLI